MRSDRCTAPRQASVVRIREGRDGGDSFWQAERVARLAGYGLGCDTFSCQPGNPALVGTQGLPPPDGPGAVSRVRVVRIPGIGPGPFWAFMPFGIGPQLLQ